MLSGTVCKTVHQYNKTPLSDEEMKKLQEIAQDYRKVKDYVYERYGGISSLAKIYPGYTVQNEMIKTNLRSELQLPFVYFNLAVFEALGDIRSQWSKTKTAVQKKISHNENLSEDEKHYLRYILKINNAFDAILNYKLVNMDEEFQKKYRLLSHNVDVKKLNNYLRRQVRLLHIKRHTINADGFSLTERAYRYGNHGIYITVKEKRKRVFVPLTDNNQYVRQIYIKLYPDTNSLEIKVPVDVKIQKHKDYTKQVGLAMGMEAMLTTNEGIVYGERLGEYQGALTDWIWNQAKKYVVEKGNIGKKKYTAKKRRMTEQLHSYINKELNRFLTEEKPEVIYIPKFPPPQKHKGNKEINYSVNLWQRGYIRKRLQQKCREQAVEVVEVFGKNISNECSNCGGTDGYKEEGTFICRACGFKIAEKCNTALNAKKRGEKLFITDHKGDCLDK